MLESRRSILLAGILFGFVAQMPYIFWLERTSKLIAEPVPENVYTRMTVPHTYVVHHIPFLFGYFGNSDLQITVASFDEVNREARRHGLSHDVSVDPVAGFYVFTERHIWCVDSIPILIHEFRHVFEFWYHR